MLLFKHAPQGDIFNLVLYHIHGNSMKSHHFETKDNGHSKLTSVFLSNLRKEKENRETCEEPTLVSFFENYDKIKQKHATYVNKLL